MLVFIYSHLLYLHSDEPTRFPGLETFNMPISSSISFAKENKAQRIETRSEQTSKKKKSQELLGCFPNF